MNKRFGMVLLKHLLIGSMAIALANPGFAQNIVKDEDTLELETMTVTADKREENIQKVPFAITAFSETDLEDAGVNNMRDLSLMVPNLDIADFSGWESRANFRGMNHSTFLGKLPLVMYIDNIPYDEGIAFDGDFDNIERIEVLRGAQGTLYGQNAYAGLINIISKAPGDEPEGKVSVEGGQYGSYAAKAAYNGPILDEKLYFGFSGSYQQTEGFMENDHPDEETFGGGKTTRVKGRLRWLVSDNLDANIYAAGHQYRNIGATGNIIRGVDYQDHEYRNPDDINEIDGNQVSLDLTHSSGSYDIKFITTNRKTDKNWQMDASFISPAYRIMVDKTNVSLLTHEFRVQTNEDDSGFKWMVGLFSSNESKEREEYWYTYNGADIGDSSFPVNATMHFPSDIDAQTQSIFGQTTLSLSDKLEVKAGVRSEFVHKSIDYESIYKYRDTGTVFGGTTYELDESWSATLPRLGLNYQFTKDKMAYVSCSVGYMPGGFNYTEDNSDDAVFDAQYSTTYELGIKTSWMDNAFIFNASIFQVDITDMQVYEYITTTDYYASNAGKARTQGVELDFITRPLEGLRIALSIGFMDAKYIDYEGSSESYDGNKVTNSPDQSGSLSVSYRHKSGFYIGGDIQGMSDSWADHANEVEKEGYWLVDAKLGYEQENWDVFLRGENLGDVEYFEFIGADAGPDIAFTTVGKPLTVSLAASVRF